MVIRTASAPGAPPATCSRTNLRALARADGKPESYHETVTVAFMALVADCRKRDGARELTKEEFTADNADLLAWALLF